MDQVQDYGYANKNPWIYCVKKLTPDIPRRKYRLKTGKTGIGTLLLKRRLPSVKGYDKLIEDKKAQLGLIKKAFTDGETTPIQSTDDRKKAEFDLTRLIESREMRENLVEVGQMMEGGYLGPMEDGVDRTSPRT